MGDWDIPDPDPKAPLPSPWPSPNPIANPIQTGGLGLGELVEDWARKARTSEPDPFAGAERGVAGAGGPGSKELIDYYHSDSASPLVKKRRAAFDFAIDSGIQPWAAHDFAQKFVDPEIDPKSALKVPDDFGGADLSKLPGYPIGRGVFVANDDANYQHHGGTSSAAHAPLPAAIQDRINGLGAPRLDVGPSTVTPTDTLSVGQSVVTPTGHTVVIPQAVSAGFAMPQAQGVTMAPGAVGTVSRPTTPPPLRSEPLPVAAIPYQTALAPKDEIAFRHWVAENKVPIDPSPAADYDMRGYWKALQTGDERASQSGNGHFPDVWKTPYHETFSDESKYATPLAPRWVKDKLVDYRGRVLADESPAEPVGGGAASRKFSTTARPAERPPAEPSSTGPAARKLHAKPGTSRPSRSTNGDGRI